MDLYILDSLYRRVEVVDTYESLIWSERMRAAGDFELHIESTLANRNLFAPGLRFGVNVSNRVMTIDTVQDNTDDEGRRMLKITGGSLESVLKQRVLATIVETEAWVNYQSAEDVPAAIARDLFHHICVAGNLNAGDIISGVTEGTFYPADTIDEPTDVIIYQPDIQDLYTALTDLCQPYAMGFRLVVHPTTRALYFDVYMGSDRTTAQTTLAAVVFSPDLDNLKNTNRLSSSSVYKNVAYVINDTDTEVVYRLDVDPSVAGFERRVIYVPVDNGLTSDQMIQKGNEALGLNDRYEALDGQLPTLTRYVYETDYYLGDLVELRDDDGTTAKMQVTEQIFISDKEGFRGYPTLSANSFIFPGSWATEGAAVEWDDMTTEEWDDL
jgi:hypothetical protein